MKNSYDKIVRLICGDNWNTEEVTPEERDGGYGVALCLAYLQRVGPRLGDLAEAIGCQPFVLDAAYRRLQINGGFCPTSRLLKDPTLFMNNVKSDDDYNRSMRSWCHIAALASGFLGKGSAIQSRPHTPQR
jgi:hypothetical protein